MTIADGDDCCDSVLLESSLITSGELLYVHLKNTYDLAI